MLSSNNILTDKTALITGSNRGIGKTIVETFALNGASVIACARKETKEHQAFLNDTSEKYGVTVRPIYFDLANEIEIKESLKKLIDERCRIDILVNNAGVAHGGFLQMTTLKTIKEVFEINFFSQLMIIQLVSRLMMRQKCGSIVNMASVVGMDGYPGYSAYGSSKAALIYATKTLAIEFAPYNIRINAIAPGLTATEMATQMEKKAKEILVGDSAMKRLAKPQEIANVALFLASDLSSFINGQVLRIDGGLK
ncbi:MAG TPA: SDR family oxidoreductase [Bacteroidales bacterium]|nr:SDR family oxidoreductase [Bacteroidales bacterium]